MGPKLLDEAAGICCIEIPEFPVSVKLCGSWKFEDWALLSPELEAKVPEARANAIALDELEEL